MGLEVDLAAALAGDGHNSGVPDGSVLLAFADAVLGSDDGVLNDMRTNLVTEMGKAALVDAAATVASYNSIVKVADATGIPLDAETADMTADIRAELGITSE